MRLYVDSMEIASGPLTDDFSGWNDGYALHVGGEQSVNDRRVLGTLALVAVYCSELSALEVAANFEAGPRP